MPGSRPFRRRLGGLGDLVERWAPDEVERAILRVREHARRAGLPVQRVTEVALEISPGMFR